MKPIALLSLAAGSLAASAAAFANVTFYDGTLLDQDWTVTTITNGVAIGSTVSSGHVLAGGNGGSWMQVNIAGVVQGAFASVFGIHMNVGAFYDPSSQGAVTAMDYSEDSINLLPLSGDGQVTGLAIIQNGTIYVQRSPLLVMPYSGFSDWMQNAAPGLQATDLWELTGSGLLDSTSNPDWSITGSTMQLGFYRGSSSGFGTEDFFREAGIDNWRVHIIPAPAAMLPLLCAVGLVSRRRR